MVKLYHLAVPPDGKKGLLNSHLALFTMSAKRVGESPLGIFEIGSYVYLRYKGHHINRAVPVTLPHRITDYSICQRIYYKLVITICTKLSHNLN